jgi:hypothetical protein
MACTRFESGSCGVVTFPDGCRSVVSAEEFEREWEIVPDGLCDDIEARFGKLFEPT